MNRCHYDFGDADWCEKPKGHDGDHSPFAPKCRAEKFSVLCHLDFDHDGEHEGKVRWQREDTNAV